MRHALPHPPDPAATSRDARDLYVHAAVGRRGRELDDATERFVETTRAGGNGGG